MNVLDIISIRSSDFSERVCPDHILHFKILAGSTFSYLYPETILAVFMDLFNIVTRMTISIDMHRIRIHIMLANINGKNHPIPVSYAIQDASFSVKRSIKTCGLAAR